MTKKRWLALDGMKALCVAAMISLHSVFWLLTRDDKYFITDSLPMFQTHTDPLIIIVSFVAIFGLLPPMIPMTAGAALRFHLKKWWNKNSNKISKSYPWSMLLKRSVFLLLIWMILNLFAWGKAEIFAWDVLSFITVSFIVITLLVRYIPIIPLIAISTAGIIVTPIVRNLLSNYRYSYWGIIFAGDFTGDNFWPLLPWIFLVLFGLIIAHLSLTLEKKKFHKILTITGFVLVVAAILQGKFFFKMDPNSLWGLTIFQPPIATVFGIVGLFSLLMVAFDIYLSKVKIRKYGIVNTYSKGILWIYLFHTIIFYRLSNYIVGKIGMPSALFIISFLVVGLIFSYIVGCLTVYTESKIKSK